MSFYSRELELSIVADPDFRNKAFAEWTAKRQEVYSRFTALVAECVDAAYSGMSRVEAERIIRPLCSEYDFNPDTYYRLDDGYIRVEHLLMTAMGDCIYNEDPSGLTTHMPRSYSLIGSNGQLLPGSVYGADMLTQINSSLHSITSLSAAATAMALGKTVVERVTLFADKVSTIFSNAYNDISGAAGYYKELLTQCATGVEFARRVASDVRLSELAQDDSTYSVDESEIKKYTGASPVGPLDFTSVGKAVQTTFNIGCKLVAGVFAAMWAAGSRLFSTGAQIVSSIVENPDDLATCSWASNTPTITGWACQTEIPADFDFVALRNQISPAFQSNYKAVPDLYNKYGEVLLTKFYNNGPYLNKWLKFDLLSGTILMKIRSVVIASREVAGVNEYYPVPIGHMLYKPKLIDYQVVESCDSNPAGPTSATQAEGDAFWQALANAGSQLYLLSNPEVSSTSVELYKYLSLLAGQYVTASAVATSFSRVQAAWSGGSPVITLPTRGNMADAFHALPLLGYAVTNDDFIAAAGYLPPSYVSKDKTNYTAGFPSIENPYGAPTIRTGVPFVGKASNEVMTYPALFYNVFNIFLAHLVDEQENPFTYQFLPYANGTATFEPERWRVKTDSENFETFNTFAVGLITAVATTVLLAGGARILSKIRFNRQLKRAQTNASISRKLLSGEALTKAESRVFDRQYRRGAYSALLTGNTQFSNLEGSDLDFMATSTTMNSESLTHLDGVSRVVANLTIP